VGQELSEEKIAQLKADDEGEVAYQRAARLLERRPRSETEIRRNLQSHRTREEVIDETLRRLRRNGLVNDEQFANLWVENQTEFRPRSRRALAYEMRQRGLSNTAIDQALEQISPEDEQELAYQAACKQARTERSGMARSQKMADPGNVVSVKPALVINAPGRKWSNKVQTQLIVH
jgi:regulatory protein